MDWTDTHIPATLCVCVFNIKMHFIRVACVVGATQQLQGEVSASERARIEQSIKTIEAEVATVEVLLCICARN